MDSTRLSREEAYQRLRADLEELLTRSGVRGAALVDGAGRLVLHVGDAPHGSPEAAVERLRGVLAAAGALDPRSDDASAFLLDGEHRVHAVRVADDLVLMVFGDEELWPGLVHRTLGDVLEDVRWLLASLFGGAAPDRAGV